MKSQGELVMEARTVFMYRYMVPLGDVRTVAYRLFASGQLCRLHNPLTCLAC
jgi:hypothetical protein